MNEWISVKDSLPEIDTPVLVAYIGYNSHSLMRDGVAAIDLNGTWGWWDGDCAEETVCVEITHWMPLPEPPEESEVTQR